MITRLNASQIAEFFRSWCVGRTRYWWAVHIYWWAVHITGLTFSDHLKSGTVIVLDNSLTSFNARLAIPQTEPGLFYMKLPDTNVDYKFLLRSCRSLAPHRSSLVVHCGTLGWLDDDV